MEKDLKRKVYLDEYKDCVLIPIDSYMVPFHVACIRNIKHTEDGIYTKVRFNFVSPNIATHLNIK